MVLLVIDVQKELVTDSLYMVDTFKENLKRLLDTAREFNVEVIYVRHDELSRGDALAKGYDGFEILDEFAPLPGEKVFDKSVNSPFRDSELLHYLKEQKEDKLVLTGLLTDYCMDAAVKCGYEHGFEIIVPEYTNSTYDNKYMTKEQTYNYYNDHIWSGRYARCLSIDDAVNAVILKR